MKNAKMKISTVSHFFRAQHISHMLCHMFSHMYYHVNSILHLQIAYELFATRSNNQFHEYTSKLKVSLIRGRETAVKGNEKSNTLIACSCKLLWWPTLRHLRCVIYCIVVKHLQNASSRQGCERRNRFWEKQRRVGLPSRIWELLDGDHAFKRQGPITIEVKDWAIAVLVLDTLWSNLNSGWCEEAETGQWGITSARFIRQGAHCAFKTRFFIDWQGCLLRLQESVIVQGIKSSKLEW